MNKKSKIQQKLNETSENLNIPNVASSENFNLSYDELFNLLKEAYRNGYAIYEMVEAGLESYDADGYARWVLCKNILKI